MKLLHFFALASLALVCAPPTDAGAAETGTTTGSGLGDEDNLVDGAEVGSGATAAIDDTAPVDTASDHAEGDHPEHDIVDDPAAPTDEDVASGDADEEDDDLD